MNKPTLGPLLIDERTGIIVIYSGPENTEPCIDDIPDSRRIAVFHGHFIEDEHHWEMTPEQIGTAHLIVAAVNACFAVNPSNPLAVAEGMAEIIKSAREVEAYLQGIRLRDDQFEEADIVARLQKALAKVEARP